MYFLLYFLLPLVKATYVITVYGDVMKDTGFFTKTFPWIIDNIWGQISVDYYLLGSGRYSVPQMCVLNQLHANTFLQAQYLKCEAEGTQSEICLCNSAIDSERFRDCVLNNGYLSGMAYSKHTQLGIEASPIVELWPKNTVFEVTDEWYLKKLCTIFSEEDKPRGCVKPMGFDNSTVKFLEKKALAYFDCRKVDSCASKNSRFLYEKGSTTSPSTTTSAPSTPIGPPTRNDIYYSP